MADARAQRSRRALLDAGIELLIQNPMASLSQIASHAGVGRATLYRHFETREQLIQALAIESLEMTHQAMEPSKQQGLTGKAALEAMFHAIMPLADRYHFLLSLWGIAQNEEQVIAIYEQQLLELTTLVEQGKELGELNRNLSTSWIVCSIDSLIYAAWWLMGHEGLSAEQAATNAIISLFNGVSCS